MGGVYQYSLGLLDAFLALPEPFEPVVAYTHPSWRERVGEHRAIEIDPRAARRSLAAGALLTWSGFPLPLWTRIARTVDPVARALADADCALWLFSAHSFVCYQMPVPSVGIVQDLMHRYERHFRHDTPLMTYIWRERVFRRMARRTRGILVDSELGRRQMAESYGADPARIHPLPFIAPRYTTQPGIPGFDARYTLPARFLFYPAQFWEHKNHARLLRAVASLKADLPDIHLVLAGGKRLGYERCLATVRALGLADSVTFLGYVPDADLAELYRRARALVYPTFYGPTNIPPLEAFVLGCPVAASGIYAMPEQLGDAALLFDPESEQEIAEAMRRLWTDDALCADLARRGSERAARWGQPRFNARLAEIMQILEAGQ